MRWGRTIDLRKVKKFKYFAGDYILKTHEKKLRIDSQAMDENSLEHLKMEFKKYKIFK